MKHFKGAAPPEVRRTHVRISSGLFSSSLQQAGVPLVRYADDYPALPWAPRWAAGFVSEWEALHLADGAPPNVIADGVAQRVVSWVQRSGEEEFAAAVISVFRLTGDLEEVKKMLSERKDLA
jgi:hypothetical protein